MEKKNKWQSRRWIVTMWSMVLITYIMIVAPILTYDAPWVSVAIPILCTIPSAYIAGESLLKNTYAKQPLGE